MNENDDFFIKFKEQVKADIQEYLGLNPNYFEMEIVRPLNRSVDFRTLPYVIWMYVIEDDLQTLCDYSGWMPLQGNMVSWPNLEKEIIEQLGEFVDSLRKQDAQVTNLISIAASREGGPLSASLKNAVIRKTKLKTFATRVTIRQVRIAALPEAF